MNAYIIESFTTGQRRTVGATDWREALQKTDGDHFTVIAAPDGQYMALTLENDTFTIPSGHCGDTRVAASDSIRQHYAAINSPDGEPG